MFSTARERVDLKPGDRVKMSFDAARAHLFNAQGFSLN